MKPRLLDLFCKEGGASKGYADAGFDVVGVDIDAKAGARYPFTFVHGDALAYLFEFGEDFDVIAGSPPCQAHTNAQKIMGNQHPDFIDSMRALLPPGKPYVIENVPGAPLRDPIELCGSMFGLKTYRHRLFESNIPITVPAHPEHVTRTTKMGRAPVDGEFMHVVGNFSGVDKAREAMGIDWMTRDGLREAIPPAYTEHIGHQLIAQLDMAKAGAA